MKCPYQTTNNGLFAECTVDCPACTYEVEEYKELDGKWGSYSRDYAIQHGLAWWVTKKRYTIVGCKYVDNLIKPTDQSITNIKNVQETNTRVMINKSIF